MSDISTFTRWKDWMLLALIGVVFSLLGTIATDNRRRINEIEVEIAQYQAIRQQGFERLRALETTSHFSRADAKEIEDRLQRQIDALERRCDELRRITRSSR